MTCIHLGNNELALDSDSCRLMNAPSTAMEGSHHATRIYDSTVSIVSVEDCSTVYDDDDYLTSGSEQEAYEPLRKKVKYSLKQKSVRFIDVSCCSTTNPIDYVSVSTSNEDYDNIKPMFWTRDDLQRFQKDAKMMHAMDSDVRDYTDAFHQARDQFMANPKKRPLSEWQLVLDGLSNGWRGLESCSSLHKVRQREVRRIVKTIVAAQDSHKLAEAAAALTAPSTAWASIVGQVEHHIAKNHDATPTLLLQDVFDQM